MFDFNDFQDFQNIIWRSRMANAASKPGDGFGLGCSSTPCYQQDNSSEFFVFAAIMMIFGGAWMREISEKLDELKGDNK
jgi:hypothetical protein